MLTYFVALLCIFGLVVGQLLFKASSIAINESGTLLDVKAGSMLFAAMALYGITSIAWVWVLRYLDLGRVYPLMALAFILVPLGSNLVFGEKFQPQYFLGVALIVIGIIVAIKS